MLSPTQTFQKLYGRLKKEWKAAFLSCFVVGLLVHMPILLSDIPNHDGLDSMYFDQNMITSGRWFLTVACGFSSYYTLPWVIGILGLIFLGFTAASLCELLEVRKGWAAALCGGLLAAFPALASTFAYVFTLDGYMLAMLLAVLAVLFTKKRRLGFLPGAVCLAFSLGVYQAYLSFAMILSIFAIFMLAVGRSYRTFFRGAAHYLYMGVLGTALYYGILQLLLKIQGKELASYQGIDGLGAVGAKGGILSSVKEIYRDFLAFSFKGNVLFQNPFAQGACIVLGLAAVGAVVLMLKKRGCLRRPVLLLVLALAALALPFATNIILLISPFVTYHLLMRYQWVLYLIGAVALGSSFGGGEESAGESSGVREESAGEALEVRAESSESVRKPTGFLNRWGACVQWAVLAAGLILIFCFCLTDNIAYSNLQKKYEKTYAYCIRLLDRIEQTEGYYPGIPIAMIGMVGEEQYPVTDITQSVTSGMIGTNGDFLLYTGVNYQAFMKHYLGATLNILPPEAMEEMYYSEEYIAMDSFPGEDSIRIMDGVMYIKTENKAR